MDHSQHQWNFYTQDLGLMGGGAEQSSLNTAQFGGAEELLADNDLLSPHTPKGSVSYPSTHGQHIFPFPRGDQPYAPGLIPTRINTNQYLQPNDTTLRSPAQSDTASYVGSRQYDSAYYTVPASRSDLDIESNESSFHVITGPSTTMRPRASSRASSTRSGVSASPTSPNVPSANRCRTCRSGFRLKSELKKHELRHEKPFKCNQPDCDRVTNGFTTSNDLDRHKKSKHKIYSVDSKMYRCASVNCADRSKCWPRLDNFKQHIERMHKDEDSNELVLRSEVLARQISGSSTQSGKPMLQRDSSAMSDYSRNNEDPDAVYAEGTSSLPFSSNYSFPLSADQSETSMAFQDSHAHQVPNVQPQAEVFANRQESISQNQRNSGIFHQSSIESIQPRPAEINFSTTMPPPSTVDASRRVRQHQAASQASLESSPAEAVREGNLDVVIRRILDQARNASSDMESLTAALKSEMASTGAIPQSAASPEAVKVAQSNDAFSSQSTTTDANVDTADSTAKKGKQCEYCGKWKPRDCDMKKHLRRHEKPFGCTFDECTSKFGSKNDWKRHESSRHFQSDVWRCSEKPLSRKKSRAYTQGRSQCALLRHSEVLFKDHLQYDHRVSHPNERERITNECHIGCNGQKQYWCGFCVKIVKLETGGEKAWDERFNHIGNHFTAHDKRMGEWVPLSASDGRTREQRQKAKEAGQDSLEEDQLDFGGSTMDPRTLGKSSEASTDKPVFYCPYCGDGPSYTQTCMICGVRD